MDMTKERISFMFDQRDMLLCLKIGFSFVRAAVACAIFERTSGFESSSETIAARYLKLIAVSKLLSFDLDLPVDAIHLFCPRIIIEKRLFYEIFLHRRVTSLTPLASTFYFSYKRKIVSLLS